MHEYSFNYKFTHIPPIMKRGRHVLIVVKDTEGKFILGSKKIYPPDIYRFVGGGINQGEDIKLGAKRELEEELKIKIHEKDLELLAKFVVQVANDYEQHRFETFLFILTVPLSSKTLTPSDDLDGIVYLTKKEVVDLAKRYKKLSHDLVDLGGDKAGLFSWSDYGEFYSEVHRIAMELS
jgi:8-oxo-dGTP pyrophosphatase MutT (NUDIX family)